MHPYTKSHRAFTLIELIIVAATINIIAALALPAYQDYVVRTKVSEGLTLSVSAKTAVIETFSNTGSSAITAYNGTGPSPENSYTYTFTPSKHVASIAIANTAAASLPEGRISITHATDLDTLLGTPLLLTPGSDTLVTGTPSVPVKSNKPIIWGCAITSADAFGYVPSNCRYLL